MFTVLFYLVLVVLLFCFCLSLFCFACGVFRLVFNLVCADWLLLWVCYIMFVAAGLLICVGMFVFG